ncbi:unnamed protein product [Rotaria sp. Silwood1]|nr:unnamed protein product [Rotaria sp. Silwood1]
MDEIRPGLQTRTFDRLFRHKIVEQDDVIYFIFKLNLIIFQQINEKFPMKFISTQLYSEMMNIDDVSVCNIQL